MATTNFRKTISLFLVVAFGIAFADSATRAERIVYIDIVAFEWDCPQHITHCYSEPELGQGRIQ